MSWFHQIENYELGNFVQATPMLKAVSELRDEPIPVFFDTKKIQTIYKKCPFITCLKKKPSSSSFETSEKPRSRQKYETNYECYFRIHAKEKGYNQDMPMPYADRNTSYKLEKKENKKYIAIFHGCLAEKSSRVKLKELDTAILNHMLFKLESEGFVPVVLGSEEDKNRFWSKSMIGRRENVLDYTGMLSLKDSVSVLAQCDGFISNDTGLYHVAGGLGLGGMVLWVQTDSVANRSPVSGIFHIQDSRGNNTKFKMAINRYIGHIR